MTRYHFETPDYDEEDVVDALEGGCTYSVFEEEYGYDVVEVDLIVMDLRSDGFDVHEYRSDDGLLGWALDSLPG